MSDLETKTYTIKDLKGSFVFATNNKAEARRMARSLAAYEASKTLQIHNYWGGEPITVKAK